MRQVRKSRGISQEKLALEADVDRSYIGLLERDAHSPTLKIVFTLARILGVRASDLVARMER